MNSSFRIFIGYFLVIGICCYLLMSTFIKEVRPSILQAVEILMIDMSHLMAEIIEQDLENGQIKLDAISESIMQYNHRRFQSKVYNLTKEQADLQFYVTNHKGIVVYDSRAKDTGKDFSQKNDVLRTLNGEYGARTSGEDVNDEFTKFMYVAAPIRYNGDIIGVVSLIKSNSSSRPFIETVEGTVFTKGLVLFVISLLVGLLISWWISRSIRQLSHYAEQVSKGKRVGAPKLRDPELSKLSQAMEAMRTKLEGKNHVEHYMHTFTHEMKSPLAAIKGAAEILKEDIPAMDKQRFVNNILNETHRMQQVVDRLLQLATVENYKMLNKQKPVNVTQFIEAILLNKEALFAEKNIRISNQLDNGIIVQGDHFLLSQAINNLIDNAIEFTPKDGQITVKNHYENQPDVVAIIIEDSGPGIPDYATDKIFDRFYSLTRPSNKHKSSGLGLSFVKEVANLHNGTISVINNDAGPGTIATLRLPAKRP